MRARVWFVATEREARLLTARERGFASGGETGEERVQREILRREMEC